MGSNEIAFEIMIMNKQQRKFIIIYYILNYWKNQAISYTTFQFKDLTTHNLWQLKIML